MGKLYRFYKRNIYGVMGTLLFHIILFLTFYIADIDIKGSVKEEAIYIEFPDLPAIPPEEIEDSQMEGENLQSTHIPSNALSMSERSSTTLPSARANDFFNEDYLKEVESARNLVSSVNEQLSKKAINIDDIEMPVQTTEGMDPDSIKNIIYTGESNITYYLENRYHLSLPVPIYLAQGGGVVVVHISVNREGDVTEATTQDNPAITDKQLYLYAKAAALRTKFNKELNAPQTQRGSIHYTFISQ